MLSRSSVVEKENLKTQAGLPRLTAIQEQIVLKSRALVEQAHSVDGPLAQCAAGQVRVAYAVAHQGCTEPHRIFKVFNAWEEMAADGNAVRETGTTLLPADAVGVRIRANVLCDTDAGIDTPGREVACMNHRTGNILIGPDRSTHEIRGGGIEPLHPSITPMHLAMPTSRQCLGPCIIDDEYFQWIELLHAVADADAATPGHFSIVELGSDYGPWIARGLAAWRFRKGETFYAHSCAAVAVEANPLFAPRVEQLLTDNDLNCMPQVTTLTGKVGNDVGSLRLHDVLLHLEHARERSMASTDWRSCLVSLVHIDVQGQEAHVVRDGLDDGSLGRVCRLIVGTHTRALHWQVEGLLKDPGWEITRSFLPWSVSGTEYGRIVFRDGLIVALNLMPSS